jgi:hypothetical protein
MRSTLSAIDFLGSVRTAWLGCVVSMLSLDNKYQRASQTGTSHPEY